MPDTQGIYKTLVLALWCMSLQAFTAERMKKSDGLWFSVSIQTNRTYYMLSEVFRGDSITNC